MLFRLVIIFLVLCVVSVHTHAEFLTTPSFPSLKSRAHLLMDFSSGMILEGGDYEKGFGPASITKLMTAYVAYQALEGGLIHIDDQVLISERAWRVGGSKMFIEVGKHVSVRDLLEGVVVQSGNDASVALSEHVAGSVEVFTDLMNQHAKKLGLSQSNFTNVSGLPDSQHYMSALDIARLTRKIISDFPDYYKQYATREFTFAGITQRNRNKLLWYSTSVDGVKTGFTDSAQYCLVASAKRDSMRLIAVVLGSPSEQVRNDEVMQLLNYGFRFYKDELLVTASKPYAKVKVWKGEKEYISFGTLEDVRVTLPKIELKEIRLEAFLDDEIVAPVELRQKVGMLAVYVGEDLMKEVPLVALEANGVGGWFKQIKDQINLWF